VTLRVEKGQVTLLLGFGLDFVVLQLRVLLEQFVFERDFFLFTLRVNSEHVGPPVVLE